MKKKPQYRQGDVFLLPTKLPLGATKSDITDGKVVLALGEATGHHHRIEVLDRPDVEAYEKDGKTYLRITGDAPADLLHEEHGKIPVRPGEYEIRIKRVYHRKEIRRVID